MGSEKLMAISELEQIGYEAGMEDGINFAIKTIEKSMDNPALDLLTPRQTLGILMASLKMKED
jgi:hypothetical protein